MTMHVKPLVTGTSVTITAKEAIAQGSTPGFLMTLANSLERLGRQYNSTPYEDRDERKMMRAQADENFRNAAQLRRVARDVRKLWATVPDVCQKLVDAS